MTTWIDRLDQAIVPALRRWSLPLLRMSLGAVFVWFGLLKVAGVTPVSDLVGSTVYWVDPDWFVPVLGFAEVAIGVGLIFRVAMRIVLGLFLVQLAGTFLVLVVLPDVAFQNGNPFRLTVEGEFVVKNLVLLSAGLVVGATIHMNGEEAGSDWVDLHA